MVDTINSAEDLAGVHFTAQDYENLTDEEFDNLRQGQQFIAHKYDVGLEQLTLKSVPVIIIEEEVDKFYQFVDQYNQWDTTPYIPFTDNDMESSHKFTSELFTYESRNESVKSNFYIG